MPVRLWLLLALLPCSALAGERAFPWTWGSATQMAGTTDAQVWLGLRSGRPTPFERLELRGWASLGVNSRVDLHVGVELDGTLLRGEGKSIDGRASALVRYRLFEPNEVLGVALLARAGFGVSGAVLEARLVLDRVIGDVLLALNSSFERTVYWDARAAIDTRFEHSVGLRLAITKDVAAGLEVRARQALLAGEYQGTAFSAGPTLSISTSWAWFSLGLVAQVASDKAEGDRFNGERIIFRDDERFGVRLIVGAPVAR